eukprot:308330_1
MRQFNYLTTKTREFAERYKNNMLKAKRTIGWMPGLNIKMNDAIGMKHIMVVISYTDLDTMQSKYKHAFKKMDNDKSIKDYTKRQREIGIWCKTFKEAVFIFGDILNEKDCLFHGIPTKLKFNTMSQQFAIPTSCTRNAYY